MVKDCRNFVMTGDKFEVILFIFALISCTSTTSITSVTKLLIDVDTGGDDMVSILMAIQAEKLDNGPTIIGITCVNGNTNVEQVALNVLKTLKVAARLDIPVYIGAAHPLLSAATIDYYYGKDGFGDFDYPDPPSMDLIQSKHAVNVMIDLVKEYPGKVTLLALGPLTNVALAIRMYPKFLDELQQIIVMGGSTEGRGNIRPGIEFNFAADPVANYIVFNSINISNPVNLVSLETTKRTRPTIIPVYKGAAHPLLLADTKDYHFGTDAFGDFDYPDPPSTDLIKSTHAVIAMIDLVKQHPGEVTLLTLGPLTNVALAIRMYPSFLDDLQQLIIMGGTTDGTGISEPGIEFNFHADPAANYVVFSSSTSSPAILLHFDYTIRSQVSMKFRETVSRFNNTKTWLIDSADPKDGNHKAVFWDCPDGIAVAVVLTSGSMVTKSGFFYSEAVHEGTQASGMIIVDYMNKTGNAANTNLIQGLNFTAFEQLVLRYFSV